MRRPLVNRGIRVILVRKIVHDMGDAISVQQDFSLQHIDLCLLPRHDVVEFAQQILLKGELRLQIKKLLQQLFLTQILAHSSTIGWREKGAN